MAQDLTGGGGVHINISPLFIMDLPSQFFFYKRPPPTAFTPVPVRRKVAGMAVHCPHCGFSYTYWIGPTCDMCGASNLPLTKEYAHHHIRKVINFSHFTLITNDAAEIMAKSPRRITVVKLDGLTELSDAAAESLSKMQCGWLSLNGLTRLSDAAAESFSKAKCNMLTLESIQITQLSDAAEESLRKFKGDLSLAPLG